MSEQLEAPAAPEGLDARVGALETGQQSLSEKVDQILGIVSGKGGGETAHPEDATQGAPNIAHEIRQQLEERDAKARAAADEQAKADRLAAAEAKIAELAEKPPEAMPRRVEKIMGWR